MKRVLVILILILTAALGGKLYYDYQTTGRLVVDVNDKAAEISLVPANPTDKTVTIGKGHADRRLKPGTYTVQTEQGERASRITAVIIKKQTTAVGLSLRDILAPQKIVDYTGRDISQNGNFVSFLNTPQQGVFSYQKGDNEASRVFEELGEVSQIIWVTPNSAVVGTGPGTYKIVNNGKVGDLDTSGMSQSVEEAVNISSLSVNDNGAIATVEGNRLFLYKSLTDKPKLSATLKSGAQVALANNGQVFIYYAPTDTEGARPDAPAIYDPATNTSRSLDGFGGVTAASWSPDSQQLAVTSDDGLTVTAITSKTTQNVTPGQLGATGGFVWLGGKLLYYQSGYIWHFDTSSTSSYRLSSVGGRLDHAQPLNLSFDKHQLLFGLDANYDVGEVGGIYSVDLSKL